MLRLAVVAVLAAFSEAQLPGTISAVCHFQATTQVVEGGGIASGTVYLTYTPGLGTQTEVVTSGMTPGNHGIHLHDFGDLSATETGTSTGPHYNPLEEIHGCYPTERKVGDMGNVNVNATGAGVYAERSNELVFLDGSISVIGRAAIVHALEDNCVRVVSTCRNRDPPHLVATDAPAALLLAVPHAHPHRNLISRDGSERSRVIPGGPRRRPLRRRTHRHVVRFPSICAPFNSSFSPF